MLNKSIVDMNNFPSSDQKTNSIVPQLCHPFVNFPSPDEIEILWKLVSLSDRSESSLTKCFVQAWDKSPLATLRVMFYCRDCRKGKGEKRFFRLFYGWLSKNAQKTAQKNIPLIPYYGSYKDLLEIFCDSPLRNDMVRYYCNVLRSDIASLEEHLPINIAAKYAPSEGKKYDLRFNITSDFIKELSMSARLYRKQMLTPLRNVLSSKGILVEPLMCANRWDEIKTVPKEAFKKYKSALRKHSVVPIPGQKIDHESKMKGKDILFCFDDIENDELIEFCFNSNIVSFSENPVIHRLKGRDLACVKKQIKKKNQGMLNIKNLERLLENKEPSRLVIVTKRLIERLSELKNTKIIIWDTSKSKFDIFDEREKNSYVVHSFDRNVLSMLIEDLELTKKNYLSRIFFSPRYSQISI